MEEEQAFLTIQDGGTGTNPLENQPTGLGSAAASLRLGAFSENENGAASEGPLTEMVARTLREAIYARRLKPGERIRQANVASELGVSRIPVREALRSLESEGLVVMTPHAGARVAVLDFAECLEIYKMRERLEPLAFSESALRLTDDQIEEIVRVARNLEELTRDHEVWLDGDRKLHLACYAGVTTPRLLDLIQHFWNTTHHYRRALLSTYTDRNFAIVAADHLLMVTALQERNLRAGEELVRISMERARLRLACHPELFEP